MTTADQIFEAIRRDPANVAFTAQGWDPLYHIESDATILIASQAPGRKAQTTKTYWNDPSGNRLRTWMGVTHDQFYHSGKIAVLPLDFYYPGKGKSGDLPPRKGFAAKWHPPLLALMPHIQLTIVIGAYAQKYYLGKRREKTLTATVKNFRAYLPTYFPIVHPSPLNYGWVNRNPWFMDEVVPALQQRVARLMA
ncbi:uracil-DNA glycosylase [Lacticaseibacillus chiayiensis]|uniref:Uracil-DNA glycosylase n=1 Tax=Lacticaseibacillus chiayiensis TaxID=2100821 RepID=A0A4Q1U1N7_9LACO|nr:uracil-DNA glycosylase family protein [Lacticaseibacillus chiayiensis]QVI35234.1 uracil-DNA glycosylase family protein [Lacticaseibacillus chiayiensis]RXT24605.1 uracil-DNA glycosylase [Lacticaseibacillus chiayiensis]RXT57874.1 uracil-DNA glycosylase [Lacticaseibacillus chiayiensis]UYN57015.1 uracil-DNA glycosylase family protein [Lacticaseibacillus chiayiensis]